MRGAAGRLRLLGGLVAHEIMVWRAVVDNNVRQHLVAAVNLTVVSHKRWQPPRRASNALVFLSAQSGTLCCGRVEQRAASRTVARRADGLCSSVCDEELRSLWSKAHIQGEHAGQRRE